MSSVVDIYVVYMCIVVIVVYVCVVINICVVNECVVCLGVVGGCVLCAVFTELTMKLIKLWMHG